MYRIKFPSGEEATIESPEALTDAVRKGAVTSYCFIMHQRSGQWLPIVRHPHYHQALTARFAADAAAGSAAGPDALPTLLPDAIEAPPAPVGAQRSTPAALEVPNLDELFEMIDSPAPAPEPMPDSAAAAPPSPSQPSPSQPKPRGRSRDLEFLYVPETRPGAASRPAPRTAGPPPRPTPPTPAPAPTRPAAAATPLRKPAAAAPAPRVPEAAAPNPVSVQQLPVAPTMRLEPALRLEPAVPAPAPASDPAPAADPAPALAAAPDRLAPTVLQPGPAAQVEPSPAPEPAETAVATLPAPAAAPRRPEWLEGGLVDPVEAALSFDGPAPIELSPRRSSGPGSSRMLFVGVGLAVVLGGGLMAWSPWSGGPAEVAAAAEAAPSVPSPQPEEAAPMPAFDESVPAEEEPAAVPDIFDVAPDAPISARTSFGGTAAQTPGAVIELPAPPTTAIPGAPRTDRVAVPVVGEAGDRDSARLAELKRQITR